MIHGLLRASHSRSPTTIRTLCSFSFGKWRRVRIVGGVKAGNSSCKQAYIGVADFHSLYHYIIPMPGAPIPAGAAGAASLISATRLSVVRSVEATLVAF